MTDTPAATQTRTPGAMQNGDLSHSASGGATPSQTPLNATGRNCGLPGTQNNGYEPWNGILIENDLETGEAVTPQWVLRKLTDVALNGNTGECRVMALELIGRHLGMFLNYANDKTRE